MNDLDLGEYLSYVYGWFVERMSTEARARFDYELTPPDVIAAEFAGALPPGLRGAPPPASWAIAHRQQNRGPTGGGT